VDTPDRSALVYLIACALLGPWYLKAAIVPLRGVHLLSLSQTIHAVLPRGSRLALALAPLAGSPPRTRRSSTPGPRSGLALFALLWVTGFDIIYATLDEGFDREHGVHSMVAWRGREARAGASRAGCTKPRHWCWRRSWR